MSDTAATATGAGEEVRTKEEKAQACDIAGSHDCSASARS